MSDFVAIEWEGLDEMTQALQKAIAQSPRIAEAILKNHTEKVMRNAKALAPVDTDFMRSGIYTEYSEKNGYIISPAGYSGFVEFGTRKMYAQPFMKPGLEQQIPFFKDDLAKAMKGAFK